MPSRLPWPSSYLSFLTRFISRRADRRSSPGLGERVREGKGAGVVEPSSPCSSLMWQSHTQPDFRTFRIGRSWSEDSRPLHRIRHRSSSAQSRSRFFLLPFLCADARGGNSSVTGPREASLPAVEGRMSFLDGYE